MLQIAQLSKHFGPTVALAELSLEVPTGSALQNLRYFSRLAGKRYSREALEALLLQAGLAPTQLLVLDEPTSGLDPQAAWEFSQVLQQLSRTACGSGAAGMGRGLFVPCEPGTLQCGIPGGAPVSPAGGSR